jgi:hypothetical protein
MNYEIGTQIGDYQILSVLGTGGMGKVYEVRNTISDRIEAMKILLPDLASQQELADRFLREIKVLASLNHPNIAALHTALRVENQLLMIMELVEGVTLSDKLQSGLLPLSESLDYIDQALSALSYAHKQGIIHRDIKPANMMLTPQGVLKLMDFGIARAPSDTKLTMTGTTLGSLHYMSPEQVRGDAPDGRSDLYSLGVVLYETVTGRRPFQETSEYSLMAAHLEKTPQAPIEVCPNLPQSLNAIILMSLAKDPTNRFQSADAMRTAIGTTAGAPKQPSSVPGPVAAGGGLGQPAGAQREPALQPPRTNQAGVPVPLPSPATHRDRGLYMALGALLVVLVIGASAIELPKWIKARAGGRPSATAPAPDAAGGPTALPQPANASSPALQPEASSGGSPSAASVNTSPGVQPSSFPASSPSGPASSAAGPAPTNKTAHAEEPTERADHRIARRGAAIAVGTGQASAPGTSVPSGGTTGGEPANPPAAPQASNSPGSLSSGAAPAQQANQVLPALKHRMDLLSSRASVVDQSLQTLQQQQSSSGLSLRGDISASWIRMKGYMDRADAALSASRPNAAKRNMDQAEREIDFLEKFLGM